MGSGEKGHLALAALTDPRAHQEPLPSAAHGPMSRSSVTLRVIS